MINWETPRKAWFLGFILIGLISVVLLGSINLALAIDNRIKIQQQDCQIWNQKALSGDQINRGLQKVTPLQETEAALANLVDRMNQIKTLHPKSFEKPLLDRIQKLIDETGQATE